ncbi:AraC family transcriptional regulator [Ruminococcaceae bacterium OttesenSCG-928-A16]|nr:AraC family transcriptional regulator [Ruminococcaceae bacterium OttesenSCG-928-A16]
MVATQFRRKEDYQASFAKVEKAEQVASAVRETYEMLFITQGTAEYWVEDQYYKVREGDILLVPAGAMVGATLKARGCPFGRHSVWVTRRFLSFLKQQDTEIDFAFKQADQNKSYLLRLPAEEAAALQEGFAAIVQEHDEAWLNAEISCAALLAVLLVRINRLIHEKGADAMLQGDANRLSEVLTYLHEKCTEPIAVEQVAERFSYSASHLAHSFKKQMGTSLYHYVLLRRLRIGQAAMLNNTPVKEAYLRCGFGDYAGFYRAFIKEFGVSPQQYKKKNQ